MHNGQHPSCFGPVGKSPRAGPDDSFHDDSGGRDREHLARCPVRTHAVLTLILGLLFRARSLRHREFRVVGSLALGYSLNRAADCLCVRVLVGWSRS